VSEKKREREREREREGENSRIRGMLTDPHAIPHGVPRANSTKDQTDQSISRAGASGDRGGSFIHGSSTCSINFVCNRPYNCWLSSEIALFYRVISEAKEKNERHV